MHYLAFCCIAKDEDVFLKEWLAYHALLGVEHFYIYDNCSRVLIRELLEGFTDGSRVTIRRIEGERMQIPAYDDCLASFGASCQWIGFLDIDEFALPLRENDLRVTLSEYEEYGGLAAPWRLFGPSGHLRRPEGPVIRNYLQAFARQESYQVKSFVRPARTERSLNPHYFGYAPGFFCVNEDHYPVSPFLQCSFSPGNRLRVNHYFMKSQQDFEHKIERGGGARKKGDVWHTMESFYDGASKPCVTDREILRFLPALEKTLREDRLPLPSPLPPAGALTEDIIEAASAFTGAGQYEKALACLCPADPGHAEKADFWTMRALVALGMGRPELSERFIRQSLIREATRTAHTHLRTLLEHKGRNDLSLGITTILERYAEYFS